MQRPHGRLGKLVLHVNRNIELASAIVIKQFSITNTIIFWCAEVLGTLFGAFVGSILGFVGTGATIGLLAGGLAFIAIDRHLAKPSTQDTRLD